MVQTLFGYCQLRVEVRFPTDIEVKTKNGLVTGVIDTIQIRSLDLNARYHNYKDELQDNLKTT